LKDGLLDSTFEGIADRVCKGLVDKANKLMIEILATKLEEKLEV